MPKLRRGKARVRKGSGQDPPGRAELPKFEPNDKVELLNANGNAVGRGSVFAQPDGQLPKMLHGHALSELQKKAKPGEHYIIVRVLEVSPSHGDDIYPYNMRGGEVPTSLKEMYRMCNYIWDINRLRKISETAESPPRASASASAKPKSSSTTVRIRPKGFGSAKYRTATVPPPEPLSSLNYSGSEAASPPRSAEAPQPKTAITPGTPKLPPPRSPFVAPRGLSPSKIKTAAATTPLQRQSPRTSVPKPSLPVLRSVPPPSSKPTMTHPPQHHANLVNPSTPQPMEVDRGVSNTPFTPGASDAVELENPAEQPHPKKARKYSDVSNSKVPTDKKVITATGPEIHTEKVSKHANIPQTTSKGIEQRPKPTESGDDNTPPESHVPSTFQQLEKGSVAAARDLDYVEHKESNEENYTDEEDVLPSTVDDEMNITGEEEEETEDEGDAIEVPDTNGRDIYTKVRLQVRIDQLVYPPNQTRDLDMKHVGELKASLRSGIDYSLGHISVCHKPSVKEFIPTKYSEDKFEKVGVDEKPIMRNLQGKDQLSHRAYYVVNGMHRGHATDRIFREVMSNKSLQDRQEFGVLDVILISRKDGKELTFYELLALGGVQNDTGNISKTPTFANQIRLCVSCLHEVLELNPNINIKAVGLGKNFREHFIIRAKSKVTHTSYARVALTFVRRSKVYQRFKELWKYDKGSKFRVSHFQTTLFHNLFSENQQLIIIDALYEFLIQSTNRYFTSPAASAFFKECRLLFDIIQQLADRKKVSMEQLLNEAVLITKTQRVLVSTYFIRTVTRFNPTDTQLQMAKKSNARTKKFDAILSEALFPKTEEERSREAEEERQRVEQRRRAFGTRDIRSRTEKSRAITTNQSLTPHLKRSTASRVTGKRKRQDIAGEGAKVAKDSRVGTRITPLPHFDDTVPSRYPTKYGTRPGKWTGTKEWVQLLNIPPHRVWSKDLFLWRSGPWLHGMGVPKKHRAHLFMSCNDLVRNHHAVYYHCALRAAHQPAISNNKLYDSPRKRTEDANTRALRLAKEYPDLAQEFLASCREKVMNKGFCVVEGIFDDTRIEHGPVRTVYDGQPASKVVEHYMNLFPSEEEIRDKTVEKKFWVRAFNNTEEDETTGEGRFITTNAGLYENTERGESTVEIARCRAALEVRALQLCVSMGLEETGPGILAIPCTGSRLYTMTHNCGRQMAHTDFGDTDAKYRETFLPKHSVDYSIMWTADDAFPILLWEHSHVLQSGTSAATRKISQSVEAQRIMIPPFSCIILRGDIVYAAPGWQDFSAVEKKALKHRRPVRFHMYICRWGMEKVEKEERLTDAPVVPEAACFVEKFQPSVQTNPSWITKDPSSRDF